MLGNLNQSAPPIVCNDAPSSSEIRQTVDIGCAIGIQIDLQDPSLDEVVGEIGEIVGTQ